MYPLIVCLEQIPAICKTINKENPKRWGSHNTYWYKLSKQWLYTNRDCNQYSGSCCWRKEKLKLIETENQQKAFNINKELKELCTSKNIRCIEHGNIHPRNHLNRSKLHFNFHGNTLFLNNICKYWVKTRVMYIRKVRNLSQEKLVTPVKIFRPCWQIFLGKK